MATLPESYTRVLQNVQEQILRTPSERVIERLVRLLHCLSPRITPSIGGENTDAVTEVKGRGIDLNVVRSLCTEGLPDDIPALRASIWKLVLGFLPPDVFMWDEALTDARATYARFVSDLLADEELMDARRSWEGQVESQDLVREEEDDANSTPRSSSTRSGVLNLSQVLDQITKDVFRTRPELGFFSRSLSGNESETDRETPEFANVWEPCTHHDALARILLVYARLNPGVQYVQGMNELSAPLYYLFCLDPLNSQKAEADAFFCFSLMMSDMRDAFVKSFDHEENGMLGRVKRFSHLLKKKDREVWQHLETLQVKPLFYAVRWLLVMLTQELEMPDIFRVWDTLLSDLARPHPFLLYLCVAMVHLIRDSLLAGDFTECMGLLQRYPPLQVDETLGVARKLRTADLVPDGLSHRQVAAEEDRPGWQKGLSNAGSWLSRMVHGVEGEKDGYQSHGRGRAQSGQGTYRRSPEDVDRVDNNAWISSFNGVVNDWLQEPESVRSRE